MSRLERVNWGNGHRYKLDGEFVPGVTTILNTLAKPALVHWAAKMVAQYAVDEWGTLSHLDVDARMRLMKGAAERARRDAAERGTRVHDFVVPMLHREPFVEPDDADLRALGHAALAFMDDWQIEPLLTETCVFNDVPRYAGTLDLIATSALLPGRVLLIDWKTGRNVYGETALQLAAYGFARYYVDEHGDDRAVDDLGITDHLVLHLVDDGTYSVKRAERSRHAWKCFAAVERVARQSTRFDALLTDGSTIKEEVSA